MRVRSIWIAVAIGLVGAAAALAQTGERVQLDAESITVLPFVNASEDPQWDSLAAAMSSTIRLSLALSGQFDYREVEPFDPYAERGLIQLSRTARENRIDAVVFGRISRQANGRIALTAAVYGQEQGRVIGEETREAFGDFDVLDAADELVLLSTSAILGFRVDYGALLLKPNRRDVPYRVYIDGHVVGENLDAVAQVLVGRRTIEIAVLGRRDERFVYSADRLVRPGEAIDISFSLPDAAVGEADEIAVRHEFADSLLGQYEDIEIAREALAESAALIPREWGESLEGDALEQAVLETAWSLEEEFVSLDPARYSPDGEYTPGSPFVFVEFADTVAAMPESVRADRRVRERVERSGAAHLLLLQLRWARLLAEERWEEALSLLDDMEAVEQRFALARYLDVSQLRRGLVDAFAGYEAYRGRGARPWPYLSAAVGLGAAGYGGYLLATDAVGDKYDDANAIHDRYSAATDPAEATSLRQDANDAYDEAELLEIVQWSSIVVGGVVAIASVIRGIQNRRAGDTYLRRWARERHGRLLAVADQVFDRGDDGGKAVVSLVVLGPSGETVVIEQRVDLLPLVVDAPPGRAIVTSRPTVVTEDGSRLVDRSGRLAVLR